LLFNEAIAADLSIVVVASDEKWLLAGNCAATWQVVQAKCAKFT
jgi:hypothetical protein